MKLQQISRTSCVCFPPTIINLFISLTCLALTFYCTRLALAKQANDAAMHQAVESLTVDNVRLTVKCAVLKSEVDELKAAQRSATKPTQPHE